MNNKVNELINKFITLPQEAKAKEIINKLKENIVLYQSLCKQYGYDDQIIINKEMADILKENVTTDDYYEAIFAYILSLEDISGKFLNNYIDNK